jgi:AAA-like domain
MSAAGAPNEPFYVVGGTMEPDSPSYIERRADIELLNGLRDGELCHVLASRQMGKSSLMARTARRLTAEGFQCPIVDITIFSEKKGDPDDWYYALVDHIADKLGLAFNTARWWEENALLPSLGKMTKFLDKVVLESCPGKVVVFVDEIDSTIRLPFSDDFFAAIRACFNARATDPRYKRLNFVLLGVATPAQLIRDATRTPFNVGRGIELTDFTAAEATALARGLHADSERAADLLRRILEWTDGHPYLTQTLCWHLVRNSTWELDELVSEVFLSKRAAREEPNLRLVRERLTQ